MDMQICPLHTEMQNTLTDHASQLGSLEARVNTLCEKQERLMEKLEKFTDDYQESKLILKETNQILKKMNGNSGTVTVTPEIENRVPGFAGALNRGWNKFRDNLAFYIIIGAIALVGWYLFNLGLIKLGLRVVF